jgi:general secretion pathway protein G
MTLQRLRKQDGFTLVELMVVISIIGTLAAIAVPRFMDSAVAANSAKVAADLRTLDNAAAIYQTIKGTAPADTGVLVTDGLLAAAPASLKSGQALYVAASANVAGDKVTLEADASYRFITEANGAVRAVVNGGGLSDVTAERIHR